MVGLYINFKKYLIPQIIIYFSLIYRHIVSERYFINVQVVSWMQIQLLKINQNM